MNPSFFVRRFNAYPHGAWHGRREVPYVFDNLRLTNPVRRYASEADLAFAAQVADYWARICPPRQRRADDFGAVR